MVWIHYLRVPRKSQLAIEYEYRVQEATLDSWVFWIHASNAARFEQGYLEIAAVAEIPERDNPKLNIVLIFNLLHTTRLTPLCPFCANV
jgi:hypothetical protein